MFHRQKLRKLHRISASIIAAYIILHMLNHIVGLAGQQLHMDFMAAIRPLYRNQIVEPLLLILLSFQVGSGLAMVVRGWRERHGRVAWAQAISGLYLAAFLLNHVISVLVGRSVLQLDTDFRFAAAGMHVSPYIWFFAPYYALAVTALFTHIGCAIFWRLRADYPLEATRSLAVISVIGFVLGIMIMLSLSGFLYSVDISERYLRMYQ